MADIKITGLAALQRALNELPSKIERNIVRSALRAGGREFVKAAKAAVPVDSQDLKKSIRVSTSTRNGKPAAEVKAGNKKAFYAHMVEFGTARHLISATGGVEVKGKKGPKKLGIAATNKRIQRGVLAIGDKILGATVIHPGANAHPFMRPALDTAGPAAVQAFADQVRKRLTKEGINTPPVEVDDPEDT